MILHEENLEQDKYYKYYIRDYVQAYEDTSIKNNNKARILDCLYLRLVGDDQGGYNLLNLQMNEVTNRANITSTSISKSIIK